MKWGGGSWYFVNLWEEGGSWRVKNWQELKSLPLICVISCGEQEKTAMVPGAWLLSFMTYFFGDCCIPGSFQKSVAPWRAVHTCWVRAAAGAEHTQLTVHGTRCLRRPFSWCPLLFLSSPQLLPLNSYHLWAVSHWMKPAFPPWPCKGEVMLVLACSSAPLWLLSLCCNSVQVNRRCRHDVSLWLHLFSWLWGEPITFPRVGRKIMSLATFYAL